MRLLLFLQLLAVNAVLAAAQVDEPGTPSGSDSSSGSSDSSSGSSDSSSGSSDSSSDSSSGGSATQSASGSSSTGVISSSFNPDEFWEKAESNCKDYLPDLTQCLAVDDKGRNKRMEAATYYYECVADTFHQEYGCIGDRVGVTWGVRPAIGYQLKDNCEYADPIKAIVPACDQYTERLKAGADSCCTTQEITGYDQFNAPKRACDPIVEPFLTCASFAFRQYAHCSEWYNGKDAKSSQEKVSECVKRNVGNLRWPADFVVAQSGTKCKSGRSLMGFLVLSNVISIISALIGAYFITPLTQKFFKNDETADSEKDMVKINLISMMWTFASEFGTAFLIMYVMQKQGYSAFDAGNTEALFLLRPRAAPLVAFVGLWIDNLRTSGVSEVVVDSGFGIVSIYYVIISVIDRYNNSVGDFGDRRPDISARIPNPGFGFYIFGMMIMVIAALVELSVIGYVSFKKGMLLKAIKNMCGFKSLQEPYDRLRKYYLILLGGTLAMYLGAWMVWGAIIGYAGELWCPASWKDTASILAVYPVVMNGIRAFMA